MSCKCLTMYVCTFMGSPRCVLILAPCRELQAGAGGGGSTGQECGWVADIWAPFAKPRPDTSRPEIPSTLEAEVGGLGVQGQARL